MEPFPELSQLQDEHAVYMHACAHARQRCTHTDTQGEMCKCIFYQPIQRKQKTISNSGVLNTPRNSTLYAGIKSMSPQISFLYNLSKIKILQ